MEVIIRGEGLWVMWVRGKMGVEKVSIVWGIGTVVGCVVHRGYGGIRVDGVEG